MNRFVLPMLLLGLAIVSSHSGRAAEPATAQERAIAEIEKLGGKVFVDAKSPGKPVIEVDLHCTEVSDAGLEDLKSLGCNLRCAPAQTAHVA